MAGKAGHGVDLVHFSVDWDAEVVTCPQGRRSLRWYQTQTARGRAMIHVAFAAEDCAPVRSACTVLGPSGRLRACRCSRSAKHLGSWMGICPGNAESGGKRLSDRPVKATNGCGRS
jgi:hypothetical protein